jgi:hypothetical protein
MKKEDKNILRRFERKIVKKNLWPSETREGMEDKK